MSAFPKLVAATRGAELMGVSKSTFYRLAKRGVIPPPIMLTPSLPRWIEADLTALIGARVADRDGSDVSVAETRATRASA